MARAMCDRHFGIGADGLLLLLPSDVADFRMRIFNADGTEAEACGNGTRCFAKYIVEKGLSSEKSGEVPVVQAPRQLLVETMSGTRLVRLTNTKKLTRIQVGMGVPRFGAEEIPVVMASESGPGRVVDIKPTLVYSAVVNGRELLLNLVSMGNPHAVCFWPHPVADFPLSELGPKIEKLAIFPNRINFEVANVVSRQRIEARVWERGVGETLACGTGACAIAVTARLHGYVDPEVNVELPGGVLQVDWDGAGEVFLSGPAEIVFTGKWKIEV